MEGEDPGADSRGPAPLPPLLSPKTIGSEINARAYDRALIFAADLQLRRIRQIANVNSSQAWRAINQRPKGRRPIVAIRAH